MPKQIFDRDVEIVYFWACFIIIIIIIIINVRTKPLE